MKRLLILIATIFVLTLSFASAYDLDVISISTTNDLVTNTDITIDIQVKNNEGFFNASETPTKLDIDFGNSNNFQFDMAEDISVNGIKKFSRTIQYTNKGEFELYANLIHASNQNDTNASNDNKKVNLTIKNTAPVITDIPNVKIIAGNDYTHQVIASDLDNDALSYAIKSTSLGSNILISGNGEINYLSASKYGSNEVTVYVSDGVVNSTETFTIEVVRDEPSIEFVTDEIIIGGPDQERSTDDDDVEASAYFTIKNDGTQTITSLATTLTISSKYEASYSFDEITPLAPEETREGTIFIKVPSNQDSQLDEIGTLKIIGETGTQSITIRRDISLETESMLEITNIEIEAKEDDDSSIDDGNTIDFLKEGDEIDMIITVANNYNEDDDIDFDISDVYVEVEASRDDWFSTKSSKKVKINAEDEYDIPLSFTLSDDLDRDSTTVYVRVYGDDDEYNFEHYDEWEITFEIQREEYEISIKSAEIITSSAYGSSDIYQFIDCSQESATLEVRVKNTGEKDEDKAYIKITSNDLDFHKNFNSQEIDTDDSETYRTTFDVPSNLRNNELYIIEVETFYDNDEDSDSKSVIVQYVCNNNNPVDNTDNTPVDNGNDGSSTVINDIDTDTNNNLGNTLTPNNNQLKSQPATGKLDLLRGSNGYVVVLAILVLLLLIAVAFLFTVVVKKK